VDNNIERLTSALADRYTIERELGAGGMATVYLAHDIKHNRNVAVKVLRPELAAVIGGERFLKEIELTANLQHPNILPLYDSGAADSFLYYVMPYVEGETLRDRLDRERQLSVEETVGLAKAIAGALSFAHERGVVHRDIKPENILLQSGQPVVADFGIALAVSHAGGTRLTETGLSLGTPHYMSPEQATGDRTLDARSDVYSLGAMVYEMLVGDPPHIGSSVQAVVAKILTDDPTPITRARKLVPPNVEAAVLMALAKSPADRFTTAVKFVEALTNPSFTMSGTTATAQPQAGSPDRHGRVLVILALVSVLLLVVAAVGWLRSPPAVERGVSRQRIVLDADSVPMEGGTLYFATALAPDGSAIVFRTDTTEGNSLWIKERDRAMPVPLPGTEGGRAPFFSPDGQWIAFSADGRLNKIARGGGAAITLSDSGGLGVPGAWMEDGTIVFIGGDLTMLLRIPEEGGAAERLLTADEIGQLLLGVHPVFGGRGVLVSGCTTFPCTQGNVWVVDFDDGSHRPLFENSSGAWHIPTGHVVYANRTGGIFAVPFDVDDLQLTGAAIPVLSDVQSFGGLPLFHVSRNGTVLHAAGRPSMQSGLKNKPVWITRDGDEALVDSSWSLEAVTTVGNAGLSISPDGTRFAFSVVDPGGDGSHVVVKQLPTGPASRLTFDGSQNIRPTWSVDGSEILWVSNRSGRQTIWRKRADGSQEARQLLASDRPVWEALWTPDGEWLVFRTDDLAPGRGDILARRTSGDTTDVELVATPAEETSPTVSPDGRWLAYASDESGAKQIYVRPFPDVTAGRWQISINGGWEPTWAHNGRELFFRDREGMNVAVVSTTDGFRIDGVRQLFPLSSEYLTNDDHRYYGVTPDDQRFLLLRSEAGSLAADIEAIVLIENWFEELRRGAEGR
jgi:serine/threonine-protein kinase